ncbi:hypothetical protein CYLTODRAFT_494094 [Cylindrobasidium torrendii FP15055 ss-10]|uniref:TPR-like protein n=1 Tax=Cylindrobasidium torrendii FP15055 ss-10 TaxID=1314674 RepID=A0A0D7AXY1_9AGAR|nr:hypothetical protein CYLTODRAFT_494094 [Cylindrobasidium torrendii FP15055 ss-10]
MPAKYSHVKKRPANSNGNGKAVKKINGTTALTHKGKNTLRHGQPNPHGDRGLTQTMSVVSDLERTISRILLLRYQQDIARLFSTRLHHIANVYLPTFVLRCVTVTGPGWAAFNADSEEVKDFFRATIGMDLRQAGERIATKSLLWSYTALRHFAMDHNVPICQKKGLHSIRLIPHIAGIKAHLSQLEDMAHPTIAKPPHLSGYGVGQETLIDACEQKYSRWSEVPFEWREAQGWRSKVRFGYDKMVQSLWKVAREFDLNGYGQILRDKLANKWCECGCSTDHLGSVCEKTVRDQESASGVRSGKHREWDGRGNGVFGWETEEEEDVWDLEMDWGGVDPEELGQPFDPSMTIADIMEWRYLRAEHEKESGNQYFRRGQYEKAINHYEAAHRIEPEVPHYQLNLAMAYLKLEKWIEAEEACTKALSQHRSSKGLFRRARARQMLGKVDEAIKDLRTIVRSQPTNGDAIAELLALLPQDTRPPPPASSSSGDQQSIEHLFEHLGVAKPKVPKPPSFARMPSDALKVKVTIMPTTDVPIWEHVRETTDGKQKLTMTMKTDLTGREREVQCLRREGIPFPGWDKYQVKKA